MAVSLPTFALAVLLGVPPETQFVEVAPPPNTSPALPRKPRAVVLVNGLRWLPFSDVPAPQVYFAAWQKPDSALVKTLAAESDVFAFAYGQSAPVTEIARLPALG